MNTVTMSAPVATRWLVSQMTPYERAAHDRAAKLADLPARMAAHGERIASLAAGHAQLLAGLDKLAASNELIAEGLVAIEAASDAPDPEVEKILVDPPEAARLLSLKTVKALYSRVARGQIPESAIYRTGSRMQFIVAELKKLKAKRGSR